MSNSKNFINSFFDSLEIWEDVHNRNCYKKNIFNSILTFIDTPSSDTAFSVYENFLKAYWIGIQNERNPFIELLEKMKVYEENAGKLIRKQRDHYMHSVNVFILGICIFEVSHNFRNSFSNIIMNKEIYPNSYDTKNEEFFYRWGIASLFHDTAYPLEISMKQVKKYIEFISCYPTNELLSNINPKLILDGINKFNELPQLRPKEEYEKEFIENYPEYNKQKLVNSIEILSNSISKSFEVEYEKIKAELYNFEANMQRSGFIDHGYYSALVIMRWYYYLIQKTNWNPAYFYFPIVDVASAILLHNYYKFGLQKEPFNLNAMRVIQHPIAYLLIVCDELQEWNRPGFGEENESLYNINDFEITAEDNLTMIYKVKKGEVDNVIISEDGDKFIENKEKAISRLVNVYDLFEKGLKIKLEVY